MPWAIYYNKKNDDIEIYPLSEESNFSSKDLDDYFTKLPHVDKWVISDNFPTEEDIDNFENAGGFESSDED